MSIIYLTEADVMQLLDVRMAIDAVSEAFLRLASGEAENVPRHRCRAGGTVQHTMSAAAGYLGLVGWKNYTTTREEAKFQLGLYHATTGDMIALVEADRLGQLRTGAVSGVAISHLTDETIDSLGMIGTGWQAQSQLAAACAVRGIQTAKVYSRNEESRRAFAQMMSADLGIEVIAVDQPQQAVTDQPLVITATNSREPVIQGDWLASRATVCAVGSNWLNRAELDVETIRRAGLIVCDSIECCQLEAGDFTEPLEQGVFDFAGAIELADLVSGKFVPDRTAQDITIFKSVGMAIEDVAVGGWLLEMARASGVGRVLQTAPG